MRPPSDSDFPNLNPRLRHAGLALHRREPLQPESLAESICRGDRVALARAITLLESSLPEHRELAARVLECCMPCRVPSFRVGITGSPGVGKSTFIEAFGLYAGTQQSKIAVLAVDPSSRLSRGSILGDKTRMTALSAADFAFIRPSPAGESLGGVARMTRDTILLCEAAGYHLILVETVGVGQSEMAVHSMTDFFLLLLLPGAGDELQGIKRGIVEMADLLVVNKADGERLPLASRARGEYLNALHLFPPKENGWSPQVLTCSATENTGIEEVWNAMQAFKSHTAANGSLEQRRHQQALAAFDEQLQNALREQFLQHPAIQDRLPSLEQEVLAGRVSPEKAVHTLLEIFSSRHVSP
ncbi:MAG: methylmalonyl Co-A mutase-associated GTPase MeaB [Saprospiraceae bacterium]|nr:methylmalonyl Co-A mutase-associated GTPase MeaB [Saprospiraceae bacterium]